MERTPGWGGDTGLLPHLDVVRELCQVLDDLPVLSWLHLQQLLDDDHRLCHHQLWGMGKGTGTLGPSGGHTRVDSNPTMPPDPWLSSSPPCTSPLALRDAGALGHYLTQTD